MYHDQKHRDFPYRDLQPQFALGARYTGNRKLTQAWPMSHLSALGNGDLRRIGTSFWHGDRARRARVAALHDGSRVHIPVIDQLSLPTFRVAFLWNRVDD